MSYVRFYSGLSFKLSTYNNAKYWDGTLEYSYDGSTWNTWDGSTVLNSANSIYSSIYLRGTNNTYCYNSYSNSTFCFTDVSVPIDCEGNIESLLDYATVDNNQHPVMGDYAFMGLFMDQITLRTAPKLGAITLSRQCYRLMFSGCTALTIAPALPSVILAFECYGHMFNGCTSLTTPPFLPATTIASGCYRSMFYGCTGLTSIPILPATTLKDACYLNMFSNSAIKLSTTSDGTFTTEYRIPYTGTGVIGVSSTDNMFYNSGSVATPDINTTYYVNVNIFNPEYKVTKSELSSIASAIREKTGNNIPLTYPNDFISELDNIQPGEITTFLSGSSLPANSLGVDGDFYTYTGS